MSMPSESGRDGRTWSRLRHAIGLLVLVVVVARVGTGPFVDGLRRTDPVALALATGIAGLTAACCAWRWRLVAEGLGLDLGRGAALAAVLRSQFLNSTLPGGILGDVDRALGSRPGLREPGPPGRGLRGRGLLGRGARSVVWERVLGQAVQVVLTVLVVAVLPSALRPLGLVAAGCLLVVVCAAPWARSSSTDLDRRQPGLVRADLASILGTARARSGIVLASTAAVVGHLVVFVLAAHTAGVPVTSPGLVSAVSVVLLASGLPLNVAGWGPREGAAAWVFAATGLGADAGVTTAVVYGVMALVATAPGAVVVLLGRRPVLTPRRDPALVEDARG